MSTKVSSNPVVEVGGENMGGNLKNTDLVSVAVLEGPDYATHWVVTVDGVKIRLYIDVNDRICVHRQDWQKSRAVKGEREAALVLTAERKSKWPSLTIVVGKTGNLYGLEGIVPETVDNSRQLTFPTRGAKATLAVKADGSVSRLSIKKG